MRSNLRVQCSNPTQAPLQRKIDFIFRDQLSLGSDSHRYKPQIRARPKAKSRAASSVEAHHCVHGPNTGRNSGGRRIIKKSFLLQNFLSVRMGGGMRDLVTITCSASGDKYRIENKNKKNIKF